MTSLIHLLRLPGNFLNFFVVFKIQREIKEGEAKGRLGWCEMSRSNIKLKWKWMSLLGECKIDVL